MSDDAPFRITLYDRGLRRRGWIGAPSRVEAVLRHNGVGQVSVAVDADHPRVSDVVTAENIAQYFGVSAVIGEIETPWNTVPSANARNAARSRSAFHFPL